MDDPRFAAITQCLQLRGWEGKRLRRAQAFARLALKDGHSSVRALAIAKDKTKQVNTNE